MWIKCYYEGNLNQDISKNIKIEIQFLMRCKSIPHIVQLLDYGIFNNDQGLIEVFDYYNCTNIYILNFQRTEKKYSPIFQKEEIKIVAKCLLEFLDCLHSKNYLHRAINHRHILAMLNEGTGLIKDVVVCGFGKSKSSIFVEEASIYYSEIDEDYLYIDIDIIDRNYYTT